MTDKDKKLAEMRAAQMRTQAKNGALRAAEFLHSEDKDIKPLKKEADELRQKFNETRLALAEIQKKLGGVLARLSKELEKHIDPSLRG